MLVLHGYAEYSGRYAHVARFFNEAGIYVFAIDHQGHGKSGGTKGLVTSWKSAVDDCERFYRDLRETHPEIKTWFVLGHSMGGGIAALLALRVQGDLAGLVLSAPLIDEATDTPGWLKTAGKMIAKILPSLPAVPFEQEAQSRDPDVLKQLFADPHNYTGKLRAGTGAQLLDMIRAIDEIPEKLTLPVWIGHGTIDRLTSYDASSAFFKRLASPDKEFRKYDGLFHEIMNEPEKRIVLEHMLAWMKKRM